MITPFRIFYEDGLAGPERAKALREGPRQARIAYRREVTLGSAVLNALPYVFPRTYAEGFAPEVYHACEEPLRSDIERVLLPRWLIHGHTHAYANEDFCGTEKILRNVLLRYFEPRQLRIRILPHASSVRSREKYFQQVSEALDYIRS
jgi:hypothetical protein